MGNGEAVFIRFETVMALSEMSYRVSDKYAQITKALDDTRPARGHLTNKDGEATAADRAVLELLDEFEDYLTTTTARYYLAGRQVQTAAERYAEVEDLNSRRVQRILDRLENTDFDDYAGEDTPGRAARDADRPDEATDEQPEGYGTDENHT